MNPTKEELILLNLARIGYITLNKLMEHFRGVADILKADRQELERVPGIGPATAEKILSLADGEALRRDLSLAEQKGAAIVSLYDDNYPRYLKNIYDPPLILYVKGRLDIIDKACVAVIGSRKASRYGIEAARRLSRSLVCAGITVTSGLARGIDSAAHRGALEEGGTTVAVVGSGLRYIYPQENKPLAVQIERSGAVISEFPMDTPPTPQNFPIRNRTISGLSRGVVVVEAAKKSGALITAACGLDQNRDLFAVPGRVGSPTAYGTHRMIKDGAKLVDTAEDVIEELNISPEDLMNDRVTEKVRGDCRLKGHERVVFEILSSEPLHIDSIIEKSDLSASETLRLLTGLQTKRLVKELPGKSFVSLN